MQKIRWFFLIVGIGLALAMVLQNNESTELQLLWMRGELPLSLMLLLATGIGFLIGALVTALMLRRRKHGQKSKASGNSASPAATQKTAKSNSDPPDQDHPLR